MRQSTGDFTTDEIIEHFEYELEQLGYPTDDVRFNLGYCQGDGMAFYGWVDLPAVAKRLLKGATLAAFTRAYRKLDEAPCLKLERIHYGNYDHWNSMRAELYDAEDYDEVLTKLETAALDELAELVQEEVRTVSRRLEDAGYEIIEYREREDAEEEDDDA